MTIDRHGKDLVVFVQSNCAFGKVLKLLRWICSRWQNEQNRFSVLRFLLEQPCQIQIGSWQFPQSYTENNQHYKRPKAQGPETHSLLAAPGNYCSYFHTKVHIVLEPTNTTTTTYIEDRILIRMDLPNALQAKWDIADCNLSALVAWTTSSCSKRLSFFETMLGSSCSHCLLRE